jgi:acyl-CoA thioester hydrolase
MPEVPFTHRIRVRYHETDPQRFVFNSRYLEYADVSMAEYFRHLGWSYPELLCMAFDPSVVKSTVDFLRPAYLDDLIDIEVSCDQVGTSSFTLIFVLTVQGEQISRIENVYVNVDPEAAGSRPIPSEIAKRMRASTLVTTKTGNTR